jgi:hypothetical protein
MFCVPQHAAVRVLGWSPCAVGQPHLMMYAWGLKLCLSTCLLVLLLIVTAHSFVPSCAVLSWCHSIQLRVCLDGYLLTCLLVLLLAGAAHYCGHRGSRSSRGCSRRGAAADPCPAGGGSWLACDKHSAAYGTGRSACSSSQLPGGLAGQRLQCVVAPVLRCA